MFPSMLKKQSSRQLPSQQLRQIELPATEAWTPWPGFMQPAPLAMAPADEAGDRALALMARCKARMPSINDALA